jgi:hypothetical protein
MPLPFSFNPMDHQPLSEFVKPPVGEYEFVAKSHEMVTFENSGNTVLAVAFDTEHGAVQVSFDLWHVNEVRSRIQHQLLGALCRAAGVTDLGQNGNEIELIYGRPIIGMVRERKDDPTKTEVFNFKPIPDVLPKPTQRPAAPLVPTTETVEAERVATSTPVFQAWSPPKPTGATKAPPKTTAKPAPVVEAQPVGTQQKMPWE